MNNVKGSTYFGSVVLKNESKNLFHIQQAILFLQ